MIVVECKNCSRIVQISKIIQDKILDFKNKKFTCSKCGQNGTVLNKTKHKILRNINKVNKDKFYVKPKIENFKKKHIKETWGTREEWKKDRSSWKKFNF